jgi:hypothetical protein
MSRADAEKNDLSLACCQCCLRHSLREDFGLLDDMIARCDEHEPFRILLRDQSCSGRDGWTRAPNAGLDQEPGRSCVQLPDLPQSKIAMVGIHDDEGLGVLLRAEALNRLLE